MKKIWPYLFLLIVLCIFARPFLTKGLLPIPSDTIVGLYNPFRDMYSQQYPRGIPFKNFLITDPVRQLIPWKTLSVSLEKNFELPLWNPYSFSGTPLLANFQTAAFYPLNVLFFLLPFNFAWALLILLQPLLGGVFMYWYLRNFRLHTLASLLGSITFAFSGFAIVWLEWGNVFATLLWLPLILLAKDKLLEKWSYRWVKLFLFAEVSSFLAGHLQVWFYGLVVSVLYLLLRIWQKNKKEKSYQLLQALVSFVILGFAVVVLTAIQWIPTVQFISQSARDVDQNYLTTVGWFIPYQHLLQFIIPDFFGNPTTLNYWGVWNYAEFSGYIGILPLLFALFAIIFRHDKRTWFFSGVALLSLLFALPTFLGYLPYQLHIPLLSTSQPTRLLAIVDFALAVLVALGCDRFLQFKNLKMLWVCEVVIGVFIIVWLVVLKFHFGMSAENLTIAKRNLVLPSIFLFVSVITLSLGMLFRFRRWEVLFGILCLALVSADLLHFADKFIPWTTPEYLFPQEKLLTYLQQNIQEYRYMTDTSQIMAPNFSVMYKLQSVDGYDPLYLRNYAEYIIASERSKPDIHEPFGFNRIITPHNYNSSLIDLVGVKYVLSLNDLHIQKLQKVYQEGETRVYENKNVLPRAFFVKELKQVSDSENAIQQLFDVNDLRTTAIAGGVNPKSNLSIGDVAITTYQPNQVTVSTNNNADGFLVLTDIYYPSWHASIDGNETKMYKTDYTFRGIFVPKGRHTIAFSDRLF